MSDTERALPFSLVKQDAILGYLLIDQKFFMLARSLIKPAWFADHHAGKIFLAKTKFYTEYNRVPSVEEMKESSDIAYDDPAIKGKLLGKINSAIRETSNFGLDVLSHELTKWMRATIFYSENDKATQAFNSGDFDRAYGVMDESLKRIKEANFEKDREESFLNYDQDLQQALLERGRALTFGISIMDNLLLPRTDIESLTAGNGSLLPGDTTVIVAPTNSGKTTSMLTTAVANARRGKSVLLMTHEGRSSDIKMKLLCCALGISQTAIFGKMSGTPEERKGLERAAWMLESQITYVPYNKAGLTVEEVEPIIRRKQDERAAKNSGNGYDLLVSDYPAKLFTKIGSEGKISKRTMDEIVYGYYIQYALEYGFHSLLAIQTNREGSRINKGQREPRLLTGEDVHESYGPIQEATNVITINRDPVAKARNRLTYYVDKSRSSETGFAVVCRTDFASGTTHSDKLGGCWYRGTDTMADNVDDLLTRFHNTEVDPTALL
jgi:hypothetical protein